MEHQLLEWIAHYGYFAIFGALVLGIIGLPIPDETILTITGVLVASGHLSFAPALFTAFCGSACGITLSYVLGRTFGLAIIHRYGKYLHIREEHIQKAHAFFEHAGHWSLTFGYYIPGVRHFTAYAAGMSCLEWPKFALFAYAGALIWSSSFIGLGYFLGDRWHSVLEIIHQYLVGISVGLAILALAYLVWRKRRRPVKP